MGKGININIRRGKKVRFMGKHREDSSDKFMSHSKDSHFKGETFFSSSIEVEPKIIIMENNTYSHKPNNPSQVFIASLRDFTFSFKAPGLINRRIYATISDDFFRGGEVFKITNFGKEVDSRDLTYSFDGEEEVEIFREGVIFRRELQEDTGKFFKFILEEEELFNFFREDNFFIREVGGDGVFSEGEDFRRGKGVFSATGGGVEESINCLRREFFDGVSGWMRGKEVEDRFSKDIHYIFKFWEEDGKKFFNIIFNFSDILRGDFSFSCNIPNLVCRRGIKREVIFEGKEEEGNGFSIYFISFSFSQGSFNEFRDGERVKEEAFKFFRREEGEEVNVVGAGGFTGKDKGFFREGRDFFDKGFKAEAVHREFLLKEDVLGIFKGTDRERMLRDIKTYKNFKTHRSTSNIKYFDGAGHCQPILHVDKGLEAQPTYNGLWQIPANSFEGLGAQVKWSCPALFYVNDSGKAKSYKFYTMNSL